MAADANEANLAAKLCELVLRAGYTRREQAFQLSSGGTSHDYVDMRRAVAKGDDLELAAHAVIATLSRQGLDYDTLGGMTMGADPVAHAVALLTKKPWFSVRKAEKSHGTGRRIEGGEVGPGVRVVCFEDTVSTGRSLLEACDVVAASGATIIAALTMLDRSNTAAQQFAARHIEYFSILTYKDLGIAALGG